MHTTYLLAYLLCIRLAGLLADELTGCRDYLCILLSMAYMCFKIIVNRLMCDFIACGSKLMQVLRFVVLRNNVCSHQHGYRK